MGFGNVNWHDVFVPDTPLLEIFVRGTIVYLAIFALLRFVLTRQSGNLGVTDLLVIVLIADAAQNAMASEYKSVPDGCYSWQPLSSGVTSSIGLPIIFRCVAA